MAAAGNALLARKGLHGGWELTDGEFVDVDFGAGIVNVDSNKIAVSVVAGRYKRRVVFQTLRTFHVSRVYRPRSSRATPRYQSKKARESQPVMLTPAATYLKGVSCLS